MQRPPSPPREDPEVAKEMMRQKRLDELMETERIYLNDMLICYHDIMPAMSQVVPQLVTIVISHSNNLNPADQWV